MCLLHPDARSARHARHRLPAGEGAGEGLQGKDLRGHLRRRDSARLRAAVDRLRAVRAGGGDLAVSRPALREAAGPGKSMKFHSLVSQEEAMKLAAIIRN